MPDQDVQIYRLADDKVALRAPWSPQMPSLCKSIGNARWNKDEKVWQYPLSMGTLRQMRSVFGARLAVEPAVYDWARGEVNKEKQLKGLGAARDSQLLRIPDVAPRLAAAMASRTYQRAAARFGAVAGSFLLADEPGLGKTATALGALIESDAWHGDVLVIAPKSALETVWARQIALWTGAPVVAAPEGAANRRAAWDRFTTTEHPGAPRFFVVNPAMIRRSYGHWCVICGAWTDTKTEVAALPDRHWSDNHKVRDIRRKVRKEEWPEILDHAWESIILDESHDLLATQAALTAMTQQTQGLFDLKANRRIALTGTPLRGQEKKIWGTLAWLDRKQFKAYWGFINQFFDVHDNGFGKDVKGLLPSAQESFHAMLDRHVIRRTRAEVRSDLPKGQIVDVLVQMSAEQRQQYNDFADMGETRLREGTVVGMGVLAELTRMRQLAFGPWTRPDAEDTMHPLGIGPKTDWVLQFLRERGVTGKATTDWLPEAGSGYKYVIASQFTEILDALGRELGAHGIPSLTITGAVTGAKRNRAQEIFQDDTRDRAPRVMLINTKAGGVSIELDAWCDEMIVLDETFIADDQVQLQGRIDNRSGRVAPRTFWYVRTEDTIEQSIAERNFGQQSAQHALLDGRRGVEEALFLMRKAS